MFSRREVIRSLVFNTAAVTGCSLCDGTGAFAQSRTVREPCLMPDAAFGRVRLEPASVANEMEGVRSFRGTIIQTSGNLQFDGALGRAVLAPLAREFGVTPGFGYYDESAFHGPGQTNALASRMTRISRTEGTVVFGLNMLRANLRVQGGDFVVMGTCAHEFGHIKQFQTGAFERIETMGLPGFTGELQADFLMGYYVRLFAERVPDTDLQAIGRDQAASGHPTIAGSHGTSAMRVRAMEAGFEYAKSNRNRSVDGALTASFKHISRYKSS
jgi:hypothetical protein